MKSTRVFVLTLLAMIAFASNSLLCRLALKHTTIDAATFTFVRIFSGAAALWLIIGFRRRLMVERTASPLVEGPTNSPATPLPSSSILLPEGEEGRDGSFSSREKVRMRATRDNNASKSAGNWPSALALFVYAAAFSFAYNTLSAGTGALLLFGAVQATMILWGFRKGESLHAQQLIGLAVALIGLVVLVYPGLLVLNPSALNSQPSTSPSSAPSLLGSVLMLGAGVAWGIYSLRGKGERNPVSATAGNFLRAVPFAVVISVILLPSTHLDSLGIGYAVLSGAITSGLGYVIWYSALPGLKATSAATVQLSVPVLTAIGGILLLGEPLTLRFLLASVAVLGGIALVVTEKRSDYRSEMRTEN